MDGTVRHAVVEAWGPDHSGRSSRARLASVLCPCTQHCSFRPVPSSQPPAPSHQGKSSPETQRKGKELSPGKAPKPLKHQGHSPWIKQLNAGPPAELKPVASVPGRGCSQTRKRPQDPASQANHSAKLEGRVPRAPSQKHTQAASIAYRSFRTVLDGWLAPAMGPRYSRHEAT